MMASPPLIATQQAAMVEAADS